MAGDSLKDMGRAGLGGAGGMWRALREAAAGCVGRIVRLRKSIGRKHGKIEQNGIPGITGVKWGGRREVCVRNAVYPMQYRASSPSSIPTIAVAPMPAAVPLPKLKERRGGNR